MVYLMGTKNREYVIEGLLIPKKEYNEREVELGKKTVVEIDDIVYAKLSTNAIFKQLVSLGDILVRDKMPEGHETMPELRQKLLKQQDSSAAEISRLMEELKALKEGGGQAELEEKVTMAELEATQAKAMLENFKTEALKEIRQNADYIQACVDLLVQNGIDIPEGRPV